MSIPFMDGRTNIQQNITLLLRGADSSNTFNVNVYTNYSDVYGGPDDNFAYGYYGNTNYVYAGYYFNSGLDDGVFDFIFGLARNEFEPFEDIALYASFVFAPGAMDTNAATLPMRSDSRPLMLLLWQTRRACFRRSIT